MQMMSLTLIIETQNGLPFWGRLTMVVMEKTPLNEHHFKAIIPDNLCQLAPPVKIWDFVREKFYCLHATADSNLQI